MFMRKQIPNFLTCCNLACGCIGIVQVFSGHVTIGSAMIWLGAIFDFSDGLAARALKVKSTIGKELDSLADMVTFGILPACIIFQMLSSQEESALPYLAFILAIFSALRLAIFNTDDRQADHFIGLPTPSSAFFVSALPFYNINPAFDKILSTPSLLIITIFLSSLMVSNLHLFSFKQVRFSWNKARWKIIFGTISLVLVFTLYVLSIPFIILLYILTSLMESDKGKQKT